MKRAEVTSSDGEFKWNNFSVYLDLNALFSIDILQV